MNYLLSFIGDITTGTRRNGSPCNDSYAMTGVRYIFFSWRERSRTAREVSQGISSPLTPASPMSVGHKYHQPRVRKSGYKAPAFALYPGNSLPNFMTILLSFDPTVKTRYVQRTFISSGILCRIFRKIEQCHMLTP